MFHQGAEVNAENVSVYCELTRCLMIQQLRYWCGHITAIIAATSLTAPRDVSPQLNPTTDGSMPLPAGHGQGAAQLAVHMPLGGGSSNASLQALAASMPEVDGEDHFYADGDWRAPGYDDD